LRQAPDGQIFVYREIYKQGVIVSDQARMIAEACVNDAPEDIVAGRICGQVRA